MFDIFTDRKLKKITFNRCNEEIHDGSPAPGTKPATFCRSFHTGLEILCLPAQIMATVFISLHNASRSYSKRIGDRWWIIGSMRESDFMVYKAFE